MKSTQQIASILFLAGLLAAAPSSRAQADVLDPITGVTVLTSTGTVEGDPTNTVSDISLTAGPSAVLGASDSLGNSGFVDGFTPNGTWAANLPGGTITYDLGASYTVSDLLIWNFSQESFNTAGANSVQILTSSTGVAGSFTSAGTYTFNEVTVDPGYGYNPSNFIVPAQVLAVSLPNTQYIELNVLSDYGYPGAFGINEVNFVGTAAPEPATYVMLGLGAFLLVVLRRFVPAGRFLR